jgi:hypothetical protein
MLKSAASQIQTSTPEWQEHATEAKTIAASLERFFA